MLIEDFGLRLVEASSSFLLPKGSPLVARPYSSTEQRHEPVSDG
jgi:hypothetical protein